MPSDLHIRECRTDEAKDLLTLWQEAETTVSFTDTIGDIGRAIEERAAIVLIAEKDDQIVGSIIGTFDGWRGNIYRLAVHPRLRRQGVARRLLVEVENRLVARGTKRITALVEKDHPWAVGYWHGVGYELDSSIVRYVRNL